MGVDVSTLQHPSGAPLALDSQSLLPYLEDPTLRGRRDIVYSEIFGPTGPGPYVSVDKRMVRDRDHLLLEDANAGLVTLHRVGRSPTEQSDDVLVDPSSDDLAALDRLSTALANTVHSLVYDVPEDEPTR